MLIWFPSPLGEQGKSTDARRFIAFYESKGFRPLSGNRENQQQTLATTSAESMPSFRPLSGNRENQRARRFPSGIFIGHLCWFPSPLGEQGKSTVFKNTNSGKYEVSVPSRGTGKINNAGEYIDREQLLARFRPLSGNRENQPCLG